MILHMAEFIPVLQVMLLPQCTSSEEFQSGHQRTNGILQCRICMAKIYHILKPLVSGFAVFDLQCRNSLLNRGQTINYVNAHNTPSLCILGIIENIRIQNDLFVAMENLDWILLFIFHSLMRMSMLVMMLETSLCLHFSL